MTVKLDYYYNSTFEFQKVISGESDFIACFIMTVNKRYVLNDYEVFPENKEYAEMDWITWLGIQFMKSLLALRKDSEAYSYIHFLEYSGGKGLEIYLKDSTTIFISYIKDGINWYSFDKKKEGLTYCWSDESVSFDDYRKAVQTYCMKIYNEYTSFSLPIYDDLYPEFEQYYMELFINLL